MTNSLGLLLAIAWRNLGRNRRRTLIAGAGIALGVGMCIASFGVMDGMSSDMVRSITDVELGHIQVHEPGFSSRPKLDLAFDKAAARTRTAAQTHGVEAVSPRVLGWALASSQRQSTGVQLVGVDPAREAKLTQLDHRISSGHYLREAPTPWPSAKKLDRKQKQLDQQLTQSETERAAAEIESLGGGAPAGTGAPGLPSAQKLRKRTQKLLEQVAPKPDSPPPVLLGDKLARKLQAKPGVLVSLMAQNLDGDPVNVDFRVVGILHTGNRALDSVRAVANLADVQRLLGLGDRAHELAIRLRDPQRAAPVARALAAEPAFKGLDVKTWKQLRPDVVAMVQTNSAMTALMVAIIFAIAAIGVADAILMSVFERRRELGMLKAIGMRPASVVLMVTVETFLLGLGASLAGLLLGVGIDLFLGHHGIALGGLSSTTLAGATIPPVLHATMTPEGVLLPLVMMVVMAVLAALWPAVVAARTEPVVAMRER